MATKVAIKGFGRIVRLALRSIIESGRRDLDVVSINLLKFFLKEIQKIYLGVI